MNDLFFIDYEAKVMLTDTLGMRPQCELAHRRLCDIIWATGESPVDDPEILQDLGRIKPQDYTKARGELILKGWLSENGKFTHKGCVKTLERCIKKHAEKSAAASAAANARWGKKQMQPQCDSNADELQTQCQSQSQSQSHIENKQTGKSFPSLLEVKTYASMQAIPEAEAVRFWDYFEASGWIDKNGHPIANWQAKLRTWKVNSVSREAEINHRAKEISPTVQSITSNGEYTRLIARIKQIEDGAAGNALGEKYYTPKEKEELKKLKSRRSALRKELNISI